MGQFLPKQFDDILERMINRVVARTDLNDINDGSSLKQVLAAAAREDDDQYYQMINLLDLFDIFKCLGVDLDERAKEFNPGLISRLPAQKSSGEVRFSRTGTTGEVTIAIGTQVEVPASGAAAAITFTTTEEGTILAGNQDSNLVDVTALVAGISGNADSSTVTGFVSKPSGVDTVINPSAFTNGQDLESDDSFRQRLLAQIKSLAKSHVFGLESGALTAVEPTTGDRVIFAEVVEDPVNLGRVTVYIDDGSGTLGSDVTGVSGGTILAEATGGETVVTVPNKPLDTSAAFDVIRTAGTGGSPSGEPTGTLTLNTDYTYNPASGQINLLPASFPNGLIAGAPGDAITGNWTYWTGLVAECQKVIDGDPSDRANYPGYRAAGVRVLVLPPEVTQLIIQANITVLSNYDQTVVATEVGQAISAYVNALGIGEDVILNELRERSMAVPGMYDIEFVTPTENTVILEGYLARLLDSNMTIS